MVSAVDVRANGRYGQKTSTFHIAALAWLRS